jgi:hypothetical protein
MTSTARRVVTTLAAMALVAASPLAVGTAAADDRPVDTRAWGLSSTLTGNADLVDAVAQARDAYRQTVLSARQAFRAALDSTHLQIQEDTAGARNAARAAVDAYRAVSEGRVTGDLDELRAASLDAITAYRAALASAKTARQAELDTAMGSAKATLAMARSLYTSAVTQAFARYAPGTSVPRALADPGWWPGISDGTWIGGERSRG